MQRSRLHDLYYLCCFIHLLVLFGLLLEGLYDNVVIIACTSMITGGIIKHLYRVQT